MEEIGSGTFSIVYKGCRRRDDKIFAMKRICTKSAPDRIKNESSFLKKYGGDAHVVKIFDIVRLGYGEYGQSFLILEYCKHEHFKTYYQLMEVRHVRDYMRALFIALAHLHEHKVIHRDVKPSNFLHSFHSHKGFCLVDFGLAQYADSDDDDDGDDGDDDDDDDDDGDGDEDINGKENMGHDKRTHTDTRKDKKGGRRLPSTSSSKISSKSLSLSSLSASRSSSSSSSLSSSSRAKKKAPLPLASRSGTRGFRAPEVLQHMRKQTVAIDIWSAGIILLCILSHRYPFFNAPDDLTALGELCLFFGIPSREQNAERTTYFCDQKKEVGVNLEAYCRRNSQRQWPPSLYQLLKRCLDLSPRARITAAEALDHDFFREHTEPASSGGGLN